MRGNVHVAALVAGLATAAASAGAASSVPKPLVGVPLHAETRLQLLVASNPPYVLDADTGRRARIRGLKLARQAVVGVSAVGGDAIIHVDRYSRATRGADVYVLRHGQTRASKLATAWQEASSADGQGVWLKSYTDRRHCSLRELGLDGTVRRGPLPIECTVDLVDLGSGAVLEDRNGVRAPGTGEIVVATEWPERVWVLADGSAISAGRGNAPLTMTELSSGAAWQLGYPSRIAGQGGADEAALHPRRRLVAVSFSDPAYHLTGTQAMDVWVLDLESRRLRQLPDMPTAVSLKSTSMHWTSDGRLVLLAETADRDVVAVWRPERKRVRVRPVRLPPRNSGSDSFVPWTSSS